MYLQRLWSRPTSGGSRRGRRGRPLAGQAAAQAPGDCVVNGGGDKRDIDGTGRHGGGLRVAGDGGGRGCGGGGGSGRRGSGSIWQGCCSDWKTLQSIPFKQTIL